jgi:hypothetical protein
MPVSVADEGEDANHAFALAATLEEQRTAAEQERLGPFLDQLSDSSGTGKGLT